ncbi:DUF3141 domain-containing protein [Polaromonas sp.]|uniref:DUF3141 domain-containing protein n=1 Tax=Polaromonas sp. TaxID=1869339 RepID=UPI0025EBF4AF|nr:DUF3141 domain-containing protein [Polaromonas sp.]
MTATKAASVAPVAPVAPVEQKADTTLDIDAAWSDAWRYYVDSVQRSVLFLDVLRERGDIMLAHERAGQPPLLDFDHELVLDARTFDNPANYALLRITRCGPTHASDFERQDLRPILVIDPRAGHGPGIGGFKHDSEVGVALHLGHPTYFASFLPEPCPGQTLTDVIHALRAFVKEIARRHCGLAPVLYGNCQGGWAVALLAADCEGLDGPAVLNGSPLSYWAGAEDVNPMRLAGGLLGGEWLTHFIADLGGGRLDGAWLVQNFEGLNPANTWWQKNYNLYANVDTESERFLEFERWWSSYFFLSREEILTTVENLFIGNRLERGQIQLDPCVMASQPACIVDLKHIRNPLVIFASSGDNITPPHQALAWLPAIYPNTEALKAAGQRIVYLLNPHVGHLGIFVSATVAQHEHRAILENVEGFKDLAPGLYEMKIGEPVEGHPVRGAGKRAGRDTVSARHKVWFEDRGIENLQYNYPRKAFEKVAAVSEWNELVYRTWVSPWITWSANPVSAFMQKWGHPMRLQRYLFSPQITPAMASVTLAAAWARENRQPAAEDNPWRLREKAAGNSIVGSLEQWRVQRDAAEEHMFTMLYGQS